MATVVMVWISATPLPAQTTGSFVNFEGRQCRPIALSPDGQRLFAVNTPDNRLSVFDISNASNPVPVLIREIPVGVEPVSVQPMTGDEAWVVNELSDSISVVSVAAGALKASMRIAAAIPARRTPPA